jgi:phage major head subunit gpT-like protein
LLEGLTVGYRNEFMTALKAVTPIYTRLCTVVDSTNRTENYPWLGAQGVPREWVDERVPQGLRAENWEIANKKYELTMEIEREAIEDDRLGQYRIRVQDMAVRQGAHPDKLLTAALNAAGTALCYDGDYLCGTNHSWGDSGTQINHTAHALDETYLQLAFTTMAAYVDDKGQPDPRRPDLLVVAPDKEFTARKLLNSTEIWPVSTSGGPNGNPLLNIMDLLVLPGLTAAYSFAVDTSQLVKPFIFQWRVRPEFAAVTDPNSDSVFDTDKFKYGSRSRCGIGNAEWKNIFSIHA